MNKTLYDEAVNIAETCDVSIPADAAVLYSISYLPTTENRDRAFAYVQEHLGAFMIEDTACGKKLVELGIGYREVGLTQQEVAQIWSIASRRFINGLKGNVTAFVEHADARSVFRRVELPLLLANPAVMKINQVDKSMAISYGIPVLLFYSFVRLNQNQNY